MGSILVPNVPAPGMTLIREATLSGASFALSSIPQNYKSIKLIIETAQNNTANGNLKIDCGGNNYVTGTEVTTNYQVNGAVWQTQSATLRTNADNVFDLTLDRYSQAAYSVHPVSCHYFYVNSAGANTHGHFQGMVYIGAAITTITISNTGGTFSAGRVYLYGVN